MRSFIRNSLIFFALGVVATVAVFYLINKDRLIPNDFHGLTPAESTVEEVVVEAKQVQETLQRVPDAGIPLATMKLSETQKTTLEKVYRYPIFCYYKGYGCL